MKINLSRLSIKKGSNISVRAPLVLAAGETLAGCRASAYLKSRPSDTKIICALDTKINTDNGFIEVSSTPTTADSIPAGLLIYYVELARGMSFKIVESNFINVEP